MKKKVEGGAYPRVIILVYQSTMDLKTKMG